MTIDKGTLLVTGVTTLTNLSPPGKLKDPPDFFGDISAKMSNVSKMSRKYVIFPGKIPESPDSRKNFAFLPKQALSELPPPV